MSYDLTNQFISNTFGNLLQKTGSDGRLYDLTGNQIGDIKISGSLTATEYIVSSSVTHLTTQTLSGSTSFGDSSDDTHVFSGSIDISTQTGATGDKKFKISRERIRQIENKAFEKLQKHMLNSAKSKNLLPAS